MKQSTVIRATLSATILAAGLANAGTVETDIIRNEPAAEQRADRESHPKRSRWLYEVLTPQGIFYTDKTAALFRSTQSWSTAEQR